MQTHTTHPTPLYCKNLLPAQQVYYDPVSGQSGIHHMQPTRIFELVIFDMDGTLIEQMLDFKAIREHLGISADQGILEAIAKMEPERRRQAEAWLVQTERQTAQNARLMPGALETLAAIRAANIKTALLTRNTRASMQTVIAKFGLRFDLAWSREDGPIKPSPAPIHSLCTQLEADVKRSWMVGDHEFDILAGRLAGARTVLIIDGQEPPDSEAAPDYVIRQLGELRSIVPPA
jgi:HAD superfamily hydrolase (TIGR01549 family)